MIKWLTFRIGVITKEQLVSLVSPKLDMDHCLIELKNTNFYACWTVEKYG